LPNTRFNIRTREPVSISGFPVTYTILWEMGRQVSHNFFFLWALGTPSCGARSQCPARLSAMPLVRSGHETFLPNCNFSRQRALQIGNSVIGRKIGPDFPSVLHACMAFISYCINLCGSLFLIVAGNLFRPQDDDMDRK
jgi:hypothetical protein